MQAVEKPSNPTKLVGALLERGGFVHSHWEHFHELLEVADKWIDPSSGVLDEEGLPGHRAWRGTRSRLDREVPTHPVAHCGSRDLRCANAEHA